MIQLFPAIDVIDGKTVRLREGRFDAKTVYGRDPLEVAETYAAAGFKNLHLVDLDGARTGTIQNLHILQSIAKKTSLHVDFGGGIRTLDDVVRVLDAGARQVNVGSMALRAPEKLKQWVLKLGAGRFIAAVDLKDEVPVASGWQTPVERTWKTIIASLLEMGLEYFSVTSVRRDGNMSGSDPGLYKKILEAFPGIRLIASGGIASADEIRELEASGLYGVILGKALLEGKIELAQLKPFLTC